MSDLLARLKGDLNAARKAQDKHRTLLIGTTLAEVTNRRIELRRDPTDPDVIDVIRRAIKRRREAAEMYSSAGRTDLADRERSEGEILQGYLPAEVSDDEVRGAVRDAISGGAANIGAVMGKVMPRFKGRADGSRINAIVREELARSAAPST
jgi:uncharacterized protein YqeY